MGFKKLLLCSWIVLFSICVATGCGEAETTVESTITEDVSVTQTDMVSDITDEPIVDDVIEEKTEDSIPENDFVTLSTGVVVDANNLTPEDIWEIGKDILPDDGSIAYVRKMALNPKTEKENSPNESFCYYSGLSFTVSEDQSYVTMEKEGIFIEIFCNKNTIFINGEEYPCTIYAEKDDSYFGGLSIKVDTAQFLSNLFAYSQEHDCRFIWGHDLSEYPEYGKEFYYGYSFDWELYYLDPSSGNLIGDGRITLSMLEKWIPYITEIEENIERTFILVETEDTSLYFVLTRVWDHQNDTYLPEFGGFYTSKTFTSSPDFYTPRFIGIGDSEEDVIRVYGQPALVDEETNTDTWVRTSDGNQGLNIITKNDVVTELRYP
ncbi:hypothetical protein [Chakrabartyella piscis]|uniref:hypothetical protein n=1 Tax=Chakrabartyella piscis TaxID=2918914 RepID=UPI0029583211|nr:hypothetical protein [Chakrabartyella piscis]